jgi:hypothetical protein
MYHSVQVHEIVTAHEFVTSAEYIVVIEVLFIYVDKIQPSPVV